jgi:hypothetical protein
MSFSWNTQNHRPPLPRPYADVTGKFSSWEQMRNSSSSQLPQLSHPFPFEAENYPAVQDPSAFPYPTEQFDTPRDQNDFYGAVPLPPSPQASAFPVQGYSPFESNGFSQAPYPQNAGLGGGSPQTYPYWMQGIAFPQNSSFAEAQEAELSSNSISQNPMLSVNPNLVSNGSSNGMGQNSSSSFNPSTLTPMSITGVGSSPSSTAPSVSNSGILGTSLVPSGSSSQAVINPGVLGTSLVPSGSTSQVVINPGVLGVSGVPQGSSLVGFGSGILGVPNSASGT